MRRLQRAWKAAEEVLEQAGSTELPIDIYTLAERHATVIKRPLGTDISGALIPGPDEKWIIVVNAEQAEVRQRFTVAHELGHLLLHGYATAHADRFFKLRDARSSEGSAVDEIQANQFAAELLMPRRMLLEATHEQVLDHAADDGVFDQLVEDLAKRFKVSRQAMAIRLSVIFS